MARPAAALPPIPGMRALARSPLRRAGGQPVSRSPEPPFTWTAVRRSATSEAPGRWQPCLGDVGRRSGRAPAAQLQGAGSGARLAAAPPGADGLLKVRPWRRCTATTSDGEQPREPMPKRRAAACPHGSRRRPAAFGVTSRGSRRLPSAVGGASQGTGRRPSAVSAACSRSAFRARGCWSARECRASLARPAAAWQCGPGHGPADERPAPACATDAVASLAGRLGPVRGCRAAP